MQVLVQFKKHRSFCKTQKIAQNQSKTFSCISLNSNVQKMISICQNVQHNGQSNLQWSNHSVPVRLPSGWEIDTEKSTSQNSLTFISDSVLNLLITAVKSEFQIFFSIFSGNGKSTVCCRFPKQRTV